MRPKEILVVDDEREVLVSLKAALTRLIPGAHVTCAGDGAEALEKLQAGTFDAVVSDHSMPGMSGVEFLHEARRLRPSLILAVLTGVDDLRVAESAVREARVDRFFSKPVSVRHLAYDLGGLIEHARSEALRQAAFARAEALTAQGRTPSGAPPGPG